MNHTNIGKVISATIGLGLLAASVALALSGDGERSDQLLGPALIILGAVGTVASPRLSEKNR